METTPVQGLTIRELDQVNRVNGRYWKKHNTEVRCFKDGGSQRNFIQGSMAKKLDLTVVAGNLVLDIHGFNVKRTIKTCEVEVPITINENTHN